MKKTKRILALIGAALLVLMYACTLIFAFIDHSETLGFLKASVACTILVPVLIYAYTLIYRLLHRDDSSRPAEANDPEEDSQR